MTAATCEYDTGSMYGCMPACSAPASVLFVYKPHCYPAITLQICARHVKSSAGRVYPYPYTTEELAR